MKTEEIVGRIENSIKKLVKEYSEDPWSFITESDATNRLYSILRDRIMSEEISIHSELRPFCRSVPAERLDIVIRDRKEPRWDKQEQANDGAMFDIVLVKNAQRFLNETYEKAIRDQQHEKLEYWRMLSYPIEAFVAAIELKVRVSGNFPKIENDVKKLGRIRDKNRNCALYLVVLDRQAGERRMKRIHELEPVVKNQVKVFPERPDL